MEGVTITMSTECQLLCRSSALSRMVSVRVHPDPSYPRSDWHSALTVADPWPRANHVQLGEGTVRYTYNIHEVIEVELSQRVIIQCSRTIDIDPLVLMDKIVQQGD